jgi:hypothetical protein
MLLNVPTIQIIRLSAPSAGGFHSIFWDTTTQVCARSGYSVALAREENALTYLLRHLENAALFETLHPRVVEPERWSSRAAVLTPVLRAMRRVSGTRKYRVRQASFLFSYCLKKNSSKDIFSIFFITKGTHLKLWFPSS